MVKAERANILEQLSSPGFVRPTIKGLKYPVDQHIGESEYVTDDSDEFIRIASERLTYVHRLDHTPEVVDWATTELEFALEHLDTAGKFQEYATKRVNAWMALGHEPVETWS